MLQSINLLTPPRKHQLLVTLLLVILPKDDFHINFSQTKNGKNSYFKMHAAF